MEMVTLIPDSWGDILKPETEKKYFRDLTDFLEQEYEETTVFPERENVFRAFHLTPYENVKVVILGQDPYHDFNQAQGLAFSVPDGLKFPPSLRNIFKELESDLGISAPSSGSLTHWAENGVLLLNTVLTVRAHQANSHAGKGWEIFTDFVLEILNKKENPAVFILWGGNAAKKENIITDNKHLILKSAHPSPLSAYRGFFGSKPFSKANAFLTENNISPIDWRLPSDDTLFDFSSA